MKWMASVVMITTFGTGIAGNSGLSLVGEADLGPVFLYESVSSDDDDAAQQPDCHMPNGSCGTPNLRCEAKGQRVVMCAKGDPIPGGGWSPPTGYNPDRTNDGSVWAADGCFCVW